MVESRDKALSFSLVYPKPFKLKGHHGVGVARTLVVGPCFPTTTNQPFVGPLVDEMLLDKVTFFILAIYSEA